MNILIDNGSPALRNLGDMAMLQSAAARVRRLWPDARLHVMNADARRLEQMIPGALPVPVQGRSFFCRQGTAIAKSTSGGGRYAASLRRRSPWLAHRYMRLNLRMRGEDPAEIDAYFRALKNSDLIIAAGGGYLNDSFPWVAYNVLETLRMAQAMSVPCALMGQGLGPLSSPSMRAKEADVLKKAIVVSLREGKTGPEIARQLGVEAGKVLVTGDDAIEVILPKQRDSDANCLGLNIRVADYAGVDGELAATVVRPALAAAAGEIGAPLLPLPIAAHEFDDDAGAIASIINALRIAPDADAPVDTVKAFVCRVARCRLVVTGSYHAGVFALAMGIPAVGIANNAYYLSKFDGLADMFGEGCTLVRLDQGDPVAALRQAIVQSWSGSDNARAALIAAAERQLSAGRMAYQRVFDAVQARHRS